MSNPLKTSKWEASLTPALACIDCGCFLPDLTRFTNQQCGETRQFFKKPTGAMIKEATRKIHALSTLIKQKTRRFPRVFVLVGRE